MKLKRFLSGVLIFSLIFGGINVCAKLQEDQKKEPLKKCRKIRNELIRTKYSLKNNLYQYNSIKAAANNYIKELNKQGGKLCSQKWVDKCSVIDEEGISWNCDKVKYLFENCKLEGRKCPKLEEIAKDCARVWELF